MNPDSPTAGGVGEQGYETVALEPTHDDTPPEGLDWRDGLDTLDALLNDCAQVGEDYQNFVRVSAVRDIVAAVRRYEDDTDESINRALYEDALSNGEPWATELADARRDPTTPPGVSP